MSRDMLFPIADLHCDLLCYLERSSSRTAYDPAVRCSIPQLLAGNVKYQTFAIFTVTEQGSSISGWRQAQLFKDLVINNSDAFTKIEPYLAVENASSFVEESEDLQKGFDRIESIENNVSKIIYLSLTWNTENRFGGGAQTKIGLKEDGKQLLDFLDQRGVTIDLSHTSDQLAEDILTHIDQSSLEIPVIASHSNFRAIAPHVRNLPDDLAKEIIRRKGLIGLNFVRNFVGSQDSFNFVRQLEHLLSLGGENNFCFGADMFCIEDLPLAYQKPEDEEFFPGFHDATAYNKIISMWKKHLQLPEQMLHRFAHQNFCEFLQRKSALLI